MSSNSSEGWEGIVYECPVCDEPLFSITIKKPVLIGGGFVTCTNCKKYMEFEPNQAAKDWLEEQK